MIVKSLKLINFRNYASTYVEFGSGVNFFVGKNAQGKTNLVEPIYILSTLKSFRNSKLPDCIMDNEPFCSIEAKILTEREGTKSIRYVLKREGENEYFVNENKLTKKREMLSHLYTVVFSPDELKIVKGAPEVRREFLDTDISQVSKIYCDLLDRYNLILLNRNKVLKFAKNSASVNNQLDVWDDQLAYVGSQITTTRQNFLAKISAHTKTIMERLTGGKETLELEYVGVSGETREERTQKFLAGLKESRLKDLELGYTTIGPHRDDIKFFVNGKEVKPFASQGQQRTVVLALKLAELETIKEEKESPVLILDDVFSELDYSRQKLLLEYLEEKQIFVTSTFLKKPSIKSYRKFRINSAKIKEENLKN